MPLIVVVIVGLGGFMGYTLNDAEKTTQRLHELEAQKTVIVQAVPETTPLVLDFRCREDNPIQGNK